jgi:hypothetical protein
VSAGDASLVNVDGVDGSHGTAIGASVIGGNQQICQTNAGSLFLTGTFYEAGIWPTGQLTTGTFGSAQRTNMANNMTGYY